MRCESLRWQYDWNSIGCFYIKFHKMYQREWKCFWEKVQVTSNESDKKGRGKLKMRTNEVNGKRSNHYELKGAHKHTHKLNYTVEGQSSNFWINHSNFLHFSGFVLDLRPKIDTFYILLGLFDNSIIQSQGGWVVIIWKNLVNKWGF